MEEQEDTSFYGSIVGTPDEEYLRHRKFARRLGAIGRFLTGSGIVTLLFVGYQLWGTGVQEAQAQSNLRDDFEQQLEAATEFLEPRAETDTPPVTSGIPPTTLANQDGQDPNQVQALAEVDPSSTTTTTIHPSLLPLIYPEGGKEVARIEIPSIDVDKIVVEGVSEEDLRKGPGRYTRTVAPGAAGNTAFAGHRTTYGAPFHNIDNLAPGDEIIVTSILGQFTYRVQGHQEIDRVGFCVEEGYDTREAEALVAEARRRGRITEQPAATTVPESSVPTTMVPQELPVNYGAGAIDGMTFFATSDIDAELEAKARAELEAESVEDELIVAAPEGVGRGAIDDMVDRPALAGYFVVSPQDTCVLDDWGDNRLTLTACHPKYSARQRIIVTAELIGSPVEGVERQDPVGDADSGLGADEVQDGDAGDAGDAGEFDDPSVAAAAGNGSDSDGGAEPANTISAAADGALDEGLGWDTSAVPGALGWGAAALALYLAASLLSTAGTKLRKWPVWAIAILPIGILMFRSFEQIDRILPAY